MLVMQNPEKCLRKKSEDITFFDDFLRIFVDQMIDTMYEEGGVGIAAPQVGVNRNVIIVDPSAGNDAAALRVMINPKIIDQSGSIESEEGCLSVPGYKGFVTRSENIVVEYCDLVGEHQKVTTSGYLAIIIQHEIDHLNGVLFVDRANSLKLVSKKHSAAEKTA